ncbi:MAG: hypothetical protein C0404_05800 [Verrucomicrobia bacterium]|nr:hypothetical protein [Verrucomicrobiota bacterium]
MRGMFSESRFGSLLAGCVRVTWSFIRRLGPLVLPVALLLATLVALCVRADSVGWSSLPTLQAAPYLVFAVSFILGSFFMQSRVSFMSILLAMITLILDRAFFTRPVPGEGEALVFMASVYVAPLMTLFYHLSERGVLTSYGLVRIVIILSATIAMVVVPKIDVLASAMRNTESIFWGPMSDAVPVSFFGLMCFVICIPFLAARNRHESPFLGRNMALALVFVFVALNCQSSLWRAGQGRTVLLVFMSGAAITLMWAVLESSWRHANIDELTELPGRRALKHHMAILGSNYAMAVLDVDYFKKINDRYGHDTGDQVLRFISSHLRKFEAGRPYRYGGEEFVMVFEGAQSEDALETAEEIRKHMEANAFVLRASDRPKKKPKDGDGEQRGPAKDIADRKVNITVSIGVAHSKNYQFPQEVLQAADKALYRAKKDGRNCVKYSK